VKKRKKQGCRKHEECEWEKRKEVRGRRNGKKEGKEKEKLWRSRKVKRVE